MKLTKIIVIITVLSLIISTSWAQEKLSLSECIQIALKNNSQLKNAQRNIDIANSGVKAAYSNILPRLDAQFMTGKTHQGEVEYFQDIPAEYEITQVNIPVLDPTLTQTIGFVPTSIIGQPTRYDQRLVTQPAYIRESNSFNLSLNQNIFDGGNWWNQIRKARS
ncbi:TolC family protein, partial [candidate division KSB1 bacterium]|nr:TolC family protein [candidate division KSB1 bacterium]